MEFYLAMILSVLLDMHPKKTLGTQFASLVFAVLALIEVVKKIWPAAF